VVILLGCPSAGGGKNWLFLAPAADLGGEVALRVHFPHRRGQAAPFLPHPAAQQRREHARAGAGEEDAVAPRREAALGLHAPEELEHHFRLLGVVALVILPADRAVLADGGLDRGRSDVEPDRQHGRAFPAPCSAMLAAVPAATPECGTL